MKSWVKVILGCVGLAFSPNKNKLAFHFPWQRGFLNVNRLFHSRHSPSFAPPPMAATTTMLVYETTQEENVQTTKWWICDFMAEHDWSKLHLWKVEPRHTMRSHVICQDARANHLDAKIPSQREKKLWHPLPFCYPFPSVMCHNWSPSECHTGPEKSGLQNTS